MHRITVALALAGLSLWSRASAAPPLEDYGKLPAVEQMRLSPAGDTLAWVTANGETRQVRVQKVGGAQVLAIDAGQLKVRNLTWMGEGHLLIEASRTMDYSATFETNQRLELEQSTIINAATGEQTGVFRGKPQIYPATFGYYGYAASGGKEYGYFAGLPLGGSGSATSEFDSRAGYLTNGHNNLYRVNLDTGEAERVAGGSDLIQTAWVVTTKGEIAAHSEYEYRTGAWRLYADPDDKVLIAKATDPTGDVALVGMGRTDGTVLVQAGGDASDNSWLYTEYRTTEGSEGEPLFADFGVSGFLYDAASGRLIGAVTEGDNPTPKLFDPALQAKFEKVRRAFPGERVEMVANSDSFDQLVVSTTGPGDSGTYFLVDLHTGKAAAVAWAYPTILQGDVGDVRAITYKAQDGLDMEGILTLPPGREAKGLPLVVMPHGGPAARDYAGFDWWAQAFASRGYAVFQPNFRGSDGFGKAFRDAGFGQWGRKMQTDISDGVAELARQGLVDPKRACVVGASYGGYAALAGVTVQQGLYRCAVSVAGVSDLNEMLKWESDKFGEESVQLRYERQFMGVKSSGDSSLAALSPRRLAAQADAPILIVAGHDDTVVDPAQSWLMADALKAAGKPVEVLQLPGEDHWLSRQSTRVEMLNASVAFVLKNNPPN
ncbi:MAG: alpha/beta hydrolase family protein [Caulobacterales bacterium]